MSEDDDRGKALSSSLELSLDTMPPQSRGGGTTSQSGLTVQSMSSPDLPTLRALSVSTDENVDPKKISRAGTTGAATQSHSPVIDTGNLSSESESDENLPVDNDSTALSLGVTGSLSTSNLQRSIPFNRSKSHHPNLRQSTSQLFPPFYNRPPTPLPPSPSLTSLLRPPFSTQTSHHTTPESSDVESSQGGLNSGLITNSASTTTVAAAVQKSAQAITPVPRASPNVPTYEYYGFALYLASSAAFLMYILWAYLPSPFLHQLGIHYYPDRWWALAVPAWLVISVIYLFVALASYNTGYLTLPIDSIENLVDRASQVAIIDRDGKIIPPKTYSRYQITRLGVNGRHSRQHSGKTLNSGLPRGGNLNWREVWDESTDAVLDIPIGGVCEILYGEGRETSSSGGEDIT